MRESVIGGVFRNGVLALWALFALFPLLWMVLLSFVYMLYSFL